MNINVGQFCNVKFEATQEVVDNFVRNNLTMHYNIVGELPINGQTEQMLYSIDLFWSSDKQEVQNLVDYLTIKQKKDE